MIRATVIKPHAPFNAKVFRDEIKNEANAVAGEIKRDFEKTTRTWEHEVKFDAKVSTTNDTATASVTTKDKVYGYVDKGTKPHIIRPKRGGTLAFKSKYRSKTTPHLISSKSGGSSGKSVFTRVVHHPGTDAREFSRDIQAKWQPKMKTRIESAINRAARKSGYETNK